VVRGVSRGRPRVDTAPVELIPIERDGRPHERLVDDEALLAGVLCDTAALYARNGFVEPWICYLARRHGAIVGTCGFTAAPSDRRVEIAYYTFPRFEGRGVAGAMAAELLAIARRHAPAVRVVAHTLRLRNASHRVLEKLGFRIAAALEDPVDGDILRWQIDEALFAKA
jgi:RimJ/RimL family protein N-acetyltransferase